MSAPLLFVGGVLRSPRLMLEPLDTRHAEAMFDGFADPMLYTWIDAAPPTRVEDLRARFGRIAEPYAASGVLWLNWPMRLAGESTYIGLVEATLRPDRVAYLAYFVFAQYMRQGYAREACAVVIEHLWRDYDAVEVRANMDYRNIPSRCLVESLGFVRRAHNKPATLRGEASLDCRYRLMRPER